MMPLVLRALLLTAYCLGVVHSKSTMNHTMRLLDNLMSNYDKRIRPKLDQSQFVVVNTNFTMKMVRSFDDISGEIMLLGSFEMRWTEERFVWKASDYGGVKDLILPKNDVWYPELFLETSLNTLRHPGSSASKVYITAKGKVKMESTDLLTSMCAADVTDYPYDQQICRLTITPNGYDAKQVRIGKFASSNLNVSQNNQWQVVGVHTSSDVSDFIIEIQLRRLSTYATMTMTVPFHLLGFLNPWVFLLPPDSGERASYSITAFLSFTVYMGIVTENMPKGSLPMANILFEVFIMLIYSVAILIGTVISLQIHLNVGKCPVSRNVQKLINFLSFAYRCKRTTNTIANGTAVDVYIQDYTTQPKSSNMPEKSEKSNVEENSIFSAVLDVEMTWTQVGNVFDVYMLVLFGLWFVGTTIYFTM